MDLEATKTHFLSIPWCATLLSVPSLHISLLESRSPKPSTEDAFFSTTLSSQTTISSCLLFYTPPSPLQPLQKINILMTLGYAVNGYPNIAHGGFVAAILDESMGLLLQENKVRGRFEGEGGGNTVTAYLNVGYKRAVKTPGTVLVEALWKRLEGRKKFFLEAEVRDGEGVVLSTAEALFIGVGTREEKEVVRGKL